MKTITIDINEDKWICQVIPDDHYYSSVETDDFEEQAETDPDKKIIRFKESTFTFANIVHELYHAYNYYTCTDYDIDLSNGDVEEMHARICERYHLKIAIKAGIIYSAFTNKSKIVDDYLKASKKMEALWFSSGSVEKNKLAKTLRRKR